MASIADMLVQGATQSAQSSGEQLKSGIQTGAALAEQIQTVQMRREQMEQAKQQLQLQKVDKLTGLMETGAKIKSPSARKAFFNNYVPKTAQALGLQDFIPEDTMLMIQADPEQAKKLSLLRAKITSGQMTYDQAVSQLDPEAFASMDESEVAQLEAAERFRVQQANTTQRTNTIADATTGRAREAREDAGQVERRKKVADLFTTYKAAGGEAGAKKRIDALRSVKKSLESGEVKLGGVLANVPYGSDLNVLARTDPKAKALVDKVRGSINIRLRTGDPNPTQNQIDQIYAQAIDPRLDNKANIAKIEAEIAAEEQADASARTEFEDMGFLKRGEKQAKKSFKDLSPEAQALVIQQRMKATGKTEAEIRKELEK